MVGWMCCNQWEKWPQWDAEDNRVAQDSMRSQVSMLRSHASAFVWANASDGRPPQPSAGRVPPDPARSALAERRRRHRVVLRHRRGGRTRLGRHPDGGPVHLATADVLVQRPLPRGARRVGRAGRQRTHSAVREPDQVHPAGQAVADQRLLVLPRRFQPRQRRAVQHPARPSSAATARPAAPRSSPARPSSRTTSRPAHSSSRSPRSAGPATR